MRKRLLFLAAIFVLNTLLLFGCGKSGSADAPAGEGTDETPEEQTQEGSGETDAGSKAEADEESEEEAGAEADNAEASEDGKYQAFTDFVSEADPKKWDGFALIDLDGDGMAELFATCLEGEREDPGIQPYMIAGQDQSGKVVINDELRDGVAGAGGYRGTLYYLEDMGLLHESMTYAPFGSPADTVYAFRNGTIEVSDTGEYSVDDFDGADEEGWDPLAHGTWTWNGETLTEEEYYGKLKEATNDTEGLPFEGIDWKDKDTILESLSGR